jgi:DNA replication protein DnaC
MFDINENKIELPIIDMGKMHWKECKNGEYYYQEQCYCHTCELERKLISREKELKNINFLKNECGISPIHYGSTIYNFEGNCANVHTWSLEKCITISSKTSGNGKTHLAVGLMKKFMQLNPFKKAKLFNFTELCIEMNNYDSFKYCRSEFQLLSEVVLVDLVCLDDIGSEKTTEKVREELYYILNSRWENKRPTIITTNLSSEEFISKYGKRCIDRMRGTKQIIEGESRR